VDSLAAANSWVARASITRSRWRLLFWALSAYTPHSDIRSTSTGSNRVLALGDLPFLGYMTLKAQELAFERFLDEFRPRPRHVGPTAKAFVAGSM